MHREKFGKGLRSWITQTSFEFSPLLRYPESGEFGVAHFQISDKTEDVKQRISREWQWTMATPNAMALRVFSLETFRRNEFVNVFSNKAHLLTHAYPHIHIRNFPHP